MLFLNITFICSAQNTSANTNSKELKFEDKSKIKTAERNPSEKETEQSVDSVSAEPVIIQRLEYKQNENTVKTEEVKPSVTTVEEDKQKQIATIESYINAIDIKVAAVKNNPEQHRKAKKSGWYKQMEKNRADAVAKKNALTNSEN